MAIKFRRKNLSLAVQQYHIQKWFPKSRIYIKNSQLYWKSHIIPTQLSLKYQICLKYKLKQRPKVRVLEPTLKLPEKISVIHIYPDGTLCLYYKRGWNGEMIIAETIVPWISEWLLYYELWLSTGQWYGGGIHPVKGKAY